MWLCWHLVSGWCFQLWHYFHTRANFANRGIHISSLLKSEWWNLVQFMVILWQASFITNMQRVATECPAKFISFQEKNYINKKLMTFWNSSKPTWEQEMTSQSGWLKTVTKGSIAQISIKALPIFSKTLKGINGFKWSVQSLTLLNWTQLPLPADKLKSMSRGVLWQSSGRTNAVLYPVCDLWWEPLIERNLITRSSTKFGEVLSVRAVSANPKYSAWKQLIGMWLSAELSMTARGMMSWFPTTSHLYDLEQKLAMNLHSIAPRNARTVNRPLYWLRSILFVPPSLQLEELKNS